MRVLMSNATFTRSLAIFSALATLSLVNACDFSTGDDSKDATNETSTSGASSGASDASTGGVGTGGSTNAPEQGDQAVDNLPQGAVDLGLLGPEIKDFGSHALSDDDGVDYFRFEVPGAGKTIIRFKKDPDSYVYLALTSADPNADQSMEIFDAAQSQENADHVVALPKGQYFLRVKYNGASYVPYQLQMVVEPGAAPEPQPEPGNHFDEALVIENIEGGNFVLGGYVGTADRSDFYRFSTPPNRTVKLSPSGTFGEYRVKVYKQDGVSGELVDDWFIYDTNRPEPTFETKEGGVYFVEITSSREQGVLYKLVGGML